MKRIASLLEAILFSMANFAIIFYFGSLKEFEIVYYYGMSQTAALIFLSFYRNFLLLKISSSTPLFANSVFFSIVLCFLSIFAFFCLDFSYYKLFIVVFLYNIIYESCRYQVGPLVSLAKIAFFVSCVLAFWLGWEFSGIYIVNILLVEVVVCILILLARNINFYKLTNFHLMLSQDLKVLTGLSLSQVGIVHLPFFYLSFWCNKNVVAALFVYRSAFQLVQIVLRSIEIRNIKRIKNANCSLRKIRFGFLVSGVLFGLVSFGGFLFVEYLFSKKVDLPIVGFLFWYFIFIFVSYSRFYDIHVHFSNQYSVMIKAYVGGTLVSFLLTLFSVVLEVNVALENPSVLILAGWFFCAMSSHLNYKDMRRDQ